MKNIFFNKVDYQNFQSWVKHANWLHIKREGVWSSTDEPKLLHWVETWLTPAGNIVRIDVSPNN